MECSRPRHFAGYLGAGTRLEAAVPLARARRLVERQIRKKVLMASQSMTPQSTASARHGWFGSEYRQDSGSGILIQGQLSGWRCREATAGGVGLQSRGRGVSRADARRLVVSGLEGVADAGRKRRIRSSCGKASWTARRSCSLGNCETVYGLCAIDLKRDGPVVIEAPAERSRRYVRLWQREIIGVGATGRDKGKGGKFLLLPPDHERRGRRWLHDRQFANFQRRVRRARLSVGRLDPRRRSR